MNEAIIFAAGSLLVMMLVAFSFTGDLKNASRETNATPVYCTESHPDYDSEKCTKWMRTEEERLLKQWEEESLSVQTDSECDPASPDYNEENCEPEDPLHKWRRLQEERVAREEKLEGKDCTCLHPIENEDPEDPLHKWRRLQCERVCRDTGKPKPD